jgi:hypothetical protein
MTMTTERTHWSGCFTEHHACAVIEVDRLRSELKRAQQLLNEAVYFIPSGLLRDRIDVALRRIALRRGVDDEA